MEQPPDISHVYAQLKNPDKEAFREAMETAVELGHAGAITYGLEQQGVDPVPGDEPLDVRILRRLDPNTRLRALRRAAEERGNTIDDPNTSVGALYQSLYGDDTAQLSSTRVDVKERGVETDANGEVYDLVDVTTTPYAAFDKAQKHHARDYILTQRGITLEGRLTGGEEQTVPVSIAPDNEQYTALANVGGSSTLYTDKEGTLLLKEPVPVTQEQDAQENAFLAKHGAHGQHRVWDAEGNSYRVNMWADEAETSKFYCTQTEAVEQAKERAAQHSLTDRVEEIEADEQRTAAQAHDLAAEIAKEVGEHYVSRDEARLKMMDAQRRDGYGANRDIGEAIRAMIDSGYR